MKLMSLLKSVFPWSNCRVNEPRAVDGVAIKNLIHRHLRIQILTKIYLDLGTTDGEWPRAYREQSRRQIESQALDGIRRSVNGGMVLGEERLKDEIERVVVRRVRPGKSGRPRKFEAGSVLSWREFSFRK